VFQKSLLPCVLILSMATAGFAAQTLELASRVDPSQYSDTAAGGSPEGYSGQSFFQPSLSADGRYAAFISAATHLVPGQQDVNGGTDSSGEDVFLEDLTTGTVTLVSHSQGLPTVTGNRPSSLAALSADGRWVAYVSDATDLVPGQQGNPSSLPDSDLLLFDRVTGATTLVAADAFRAAVFFSLAFSADGRYLAFGARGIFIPGQQGEGDVNNIFVYDRVSGSVRLASHPSGLPTTGAGGYGNTEISADGRYAVFTSSSGLLPGQADGNQNVFLYDRTTDSLTLVGAGDTPRLSADGKYVLFERSTPGPLLLYSRETRVTLQVSAGISFSVPSAVPPYSLSADGRYAAFVGYQSTPAGAIPQVQVFDRVARTTTGVARATGDSSYLGIESAAISGDGRFVAFASADFHQVSGQVDAIRPSGANLDLFLYDRAARKTALVSHTAAAPLTTGDGESRAPALSANGSRLVFTSVADDLVGDLADRNGAPDLFAYDVAARNLDAATRHAGGLPALSPDAGSHARALSADGRWLAYESDSARIVAGQQDTNGKTDVFLYDAATRTTVLVSHVPSSATTAPQGASSSPAVSADGRWVTFVSDARNLVPGANPASRPCVFLWDRTTGGVTFVARMGSKTNPNSFVYSAAPRISPDGRWIAFASSASDLVPGQQDPGTDPETILNVFLWDRETRALTLVSHSASGPLVEGFGDSDTPVLSDDGRFVAFHSIARDLVPGQTRGGSDNLFLFDRTTGANVLVSRTRSSATEPGDALFILPVLSADGRFMLFTSRAGGLDPGIPSGDLNVYLYDASLRTYQEISTQGTFGRQLSLSADGRFAAFISGQQVYLYDRVAKTLALASHTPGGFSSNGDADAPAVSADGRYVAFVSDASDLVAGQIPAPGRASFEASAYLYDRISGQVTLLSRWQGSPTTAASGAGAPLISADGQRIAFDSGIDLLSGDFNRRTDAYLFRLDGGSTGGGGPVTVPPCILFDTRRPADGPALRSNVARVVKATGACGVPATAARVTVKVTAFQGTGKGNVRLYPGDLSAPSAGILRFSRGQTASAVFDLPVASNGAGTLTLLPFVAGNGTAGVSVEVDGYTP